MNKKYVIGLVLLLVIILVWWMMSSKQEAAPTDTTDQAASAAATFEQDLSGINEANITSEFQTVDTDLQSL